MLRLALLSLLLGAGMCQSDSSSSSGDLAGGASSASAAPSAAEAPSAEAPSSSAQPAAGGGGSVQAAIPTLDFPIGTWQLTETEGAPVSPVATITWTFNADGTGVYAQDIQHRMWDAADASRPIQWTRVSDGVVRSESSTFTRTGERTARWSDSGSSGTLQRWE